MLFEDLKSKNGNWHAGIRLEGRVALEQGFTILVGDTVLSIEESTQSPDTESPFSVDTSPRGPSDAPPLEENRQPTETIDLRVLSTPAPAPATMPGESPRARPLPVRAQPRFVTSTKVELRVENRDELKPLWIESISRGGLFVETDRPPARGTNVEIRLETPQGVLHLQATVVHVLDAETARGMGRSAGAGLQFGNLDRGTHKALGAYVDGLSTALRAERASAPVSARPAPAADVVAMARRIVDSSERNNVYTALALPATSTTERLQKSIDELRTKLASTIATTATTEGTLFRDALTFLGRAQALIRDPLKRLDYDFRNGHERVEDRIAMARAPTGIPLDVLRRVWNEAHPARLKRASELTRLAFEARQENRLHDAIALGNEVLELNPFFDEFRRSLVNWKQRLEIQEREALFSPLERRGSPRLKP